MGKDPEGYSLDEQDFIMIALYRHDVLSYKNN